MKTKTYHLTNSELVAQLSLRDDLNELESELLDRLTRAVAEIENMERGVIYTHREESTA